MKETVLTWEGKVSSKDHEEILKQRIIALDYEDNPNTELVHQVIDHDEEKANPPFTNEFILTVSPHTPPRGKEQRYGQGDSITLSEWATRPYGNPDKEVAHDVQLKVVEDGIGYATVTVEQRQAPPKRESTGEDWSVSPAYSIVKSDRFSVGDADSKQGHDQQAKPDSPEADPAPTGERGDLQSKMPESIK